MYGSPVALHFGLDRLIRRLAEFASLGVFQVWASILRHSGHEPQVVVTGSARELRAAEVFVQQDRLVFVLGSHSRAAVVDGDAVVRQLSEAGEGGRLVGVRRPIALPRPVLAHVLVADLGHIETAARAAECSLLWLLREGRPVCRGGHDACARLGPRRLSLLLDILVTFDAAEVHVLPVVVWVFNL